MRNLLKVRSTGRLSKMAIAVGGLGLAAVIGAGPAFAAGGAGVSTPGHSAATGAQTKGTAVIHYSAAYTDYFFGSVSVSGVHQVKNGAAQDSFTATSTNGGLTSSAVPRLTARR